MHPHKQDCMCGVFINNYIDTQKCMEMFQGHTQYMLHMTG